MSWLWGKGIGLVMVSSLAFNLGVGATFGIRAYNHHFGKPFGPPHGQRHRAFLQRLDLRADQADRIEAEGTVFHPKMRELHHSLADASAALADLLVAAEPDREAIATKLEELAELRAEKYRLIAEHFLRVSELLNEDQREAFAHEIRGILMRLGMGPPDGGRHGKMLGRPGRGPGQGRHWREHDD